jgi:hypothetical protein
MRPGIVETKHNNPQDLQQIRNGTGDQRYVVGRLICFKNAAYRGSSLHEASVIAMAD